MLPSGKSKAFCVVITRALRVYPLVLEPPRLICVRGLQGVGGVAFMIVSQKVVIRDNMAVQEPDIPTRGRGMSHCSRLEPA